MNDIPRRIRVDLLAPAEIAIVKALEAVEALGAAPTLTDAVQRLQEAREHVADYVDEHVREHVHIQQRERLPDGKYIWNDKGHFVPIG